MRCELGDGAWLRSYQFKILANQVVKLPAKYIKMSIQLKLVLKRMLSTFPGCNPKTSASLKYCAISTPQAKTKIETERINGEMS